VFTEGVTKPPESHLDLLEKPLFAHLATVGSDGAPRSNPMWFIYDPKSNRIRLTHTRTRHNHRHLKDEPRIAMSITDPTDQYRYLQVRGEVENEEDDPEGQFYQLLQQRYRGYTTDVADKKVRVIYTIRPTAWKVRPVT
jgi:PPOX class probable F420-dependent enzyme